MQARRQDARAEQKPSAAALKHIEAAVGQAVDLEAFMKLYEAAPASEKAALWAQKRGVMLQYAVASASTLLERQPWLEQVIIWFSLQSMDLASVLCGLTGEAAMARTDESATWVGDQAGWTAAESLSGSIHCRVQRRDLRSGLQAA